MVGNRQMAEIVDLNSRRPLPNPGNGAREALIEIGKNCPFHVQEDIAHHWADDVLANLWGSGFKVVPLDPSDDR